MFAQKPSEVDFRAMTENVTDSLNKCYYPKLLKRFLDNDGNLDANELMLLNHGYTQEPSYEPYRSFQNEADMYCLFSKKKYKEAIEAGKKYLETNPVSLLGNWIMAMAFKGLGDMEMNKNYEHKYQNMLSAIMETGDGGSFQDAFIVINPIDAYRVIKHLGYIFKSRGFEFDFNFYAYDVMTVIAMGGEKTEEKKLYFNITMPFSTLTNTFQEKKINDSTAEIKNSVIPVPIQILGNNN